MVDGRWAMEFWEDHYNSLQHLCGGESAAVVALANVSVFEFHSLMQSRLVYVEEQERLYEEARRNNQNKK